MPGFYMQGVIMQNLFIPIRNISGKMVCSIDYQNKIVEIVRKGEKTTIHVNKNGEFEITHK